MNKCKIMDINNKIDKLKVVSYDEETLKSLSSFMSIIKGKYTLNNNKTITREKIIKNIGTGNAV